MESYKVTVKDNKTHFTAICKTLNIELNADTVEHAMWAIKEEIEKFGAYEMRKGKKVPKEQEELQEGQYIIFCDIEGRFKASANEMVRRSISLPYWLNELINRSDINASEVFRSAVTKEIEGVKDQEIVTTEDLEKRVDKNVLDRYVKEKLSAALNI